MKKTLLLGIIFTILYSSGPIIMKIGLMSAPPLTLATLRFLVAGAILFIFIYGIKKGKYPLPNKNQFKVLFVLGLLNTAVFAALGTLALQSMSAGLFGLFLPINPFLFHVLSMIFMRTKMRLIEWFGMVVSALGIFIACYPSIANSHGSLSGILLLSAAMASMAIGSMTYKKANLQLPNLVINGWQTIIGGVLLIIPTLYLDHGKSITWDVNFIEYIIWSVIVLSIVSMGIWFHLLKHDPTRANNWMLLNPISGYILAALVLGEPLTRYNVVATVVVLLGLYMSGNFKFSNKKAIQTSK